MSTTLFFRSAARDSLTPQAKDQILTGSAYSSLDGSSLGFYSQDPLTTDRGSGWTTFSTFAVTGPTDGVEIGYSSGLVIAYVVPPFSQDVTISGSITFNFWAYEGTKNNNAAINCRLMKWSSADGSLTQFHKTTRTTEVGTSSSNNSWSETPSSTTFYKGDRIVVIPFFDDAGTMGEPSYQLQFMVNGTSGSGDSNIVFTETLPFATDPSGTTVYPTTTSAGINPGGATEYESWTSRGSGVTTAVTSTAAGYTSPIQVTATGGGTAVEWYTKPLLPTTLSGPVLVNARFAVSSTSAKAAIRCEIHRVDGDGTNATLFGICGYPRSGTSSEQAIGFWVYGPDLAITDGQRLRVRFFIDDSSAAMASGYTATLYYAGSSGATGDTYLTFSQTLSSQRGFTVDAAIAGTVSDDFTLDAWISGTAISDSFTLDAAIVTKRTFGTDTRILGSLFNSIASRKVQSNVSYAQLLAGNFNFSGSGYKGVGQNYIPGWWGALASALVFPYMPLYAGETITSAVFQMHGWESFGVPQDFSDTDFTIEARYFDWTVTGYVDAVEDDWKNQSEVASAPLLAHFDTTPGWACGKTPWNTFTEDDLSSYINAASAVPPGTPNLSAGAGPSTTKLWLVSSRYRLGSEPTGDEYVYGADASLYYANPRIIVSINGGSGISLDAQITGTVSESFTLDAEIDVAGQTYWTTPANLAQISPQPTLAFTIPSLAGNLHFEIQLDKVDTFDGPDLRVLCSVVDQVGWEFWDGDSWEAVPAGGVPDSYVGNEARHAIQVPLEGGTWYRRVRTGRSG